ncbi:hypothetical protein [Roseibium litorale]|uniref:Uncharacterized protein n=1 Tax=Roseibium litorale TaxID=2803841 RepID=A0ABR9CKU6_9HYPH|nr:hypothetical protein [Roseibium litorale]MBD8891279.1 hypothetical protein [Roseibium litorale]
MPCFCTVPADAARNMFIPGITPMFPSVPLSLKLAAALPNLDPASRLDVQIAAGMNPVAMPNVNFGGGPMIGLSMMLSLVAGNFVLDNLPMLEMQMQQAATSLVNNVWPRLGWLTSLKLQPLVNYAIIARLVIDLQAMGLDPIAMTAFPPAPYFTSFSTVLTRPQITMAKFLGGLPSLLKMNQALNLPPLGDAGAMPALQNHLMGLAKLSPPNLVVPTPLLQKLALVLEALTTINQAFGDGFSPMTISTIERMLAVWSKFQVPIPLGALRLNNLLLTLPKLEDIQLGESMAGSSSFAMPIAQFTPPKLAIAPFLNLVMALHAGLQVALDMEPFDMCSMCNCA